MNQPTLKLRCPEQTEGSFVEVLELNENFKRGEVVGRDCRLFVTSDEYERLRHNFID